MQIKCFEKFFNVWDPIVVTFLLLSSSSSSSFSSWNWKSPVLQIIFGCNNYGPLCTVIKLKKGLWKPPRLGSEKAPLFSLMHLRPFRISNSNSSILCEISFWSCAKMKREFDIWNPTALEIREWSQIQCLNSFMYQFLKNLKEISFFLFFSLLGSIVLSIMTDHEPRPQEALIYHVDRITKM